jgi:hypothetical protein
MNPMQVVEECSIVASGQGIGEHCPPSNLFVIASHLRLPTGAYPGSQVNRHSEPVVPLHTVCEWLSAFAWHCFGFTTASHFKASEVGIKVSAVTAIFVAPHHNETAAMTARLAARGISSAGLRQPQWKTRVTQLDFRGCIIIAFIQGHRL